MSTFLPFDDALAVAQSLGLASEKEWRVWNKEGLRPPNVPSAPDRTYKDAGWQGWGHWLGTGNANSANKEFLPFAEALAVARSLGRAGLAGRDEWRHGARMACGPPTCPPTHKRSTRTTGGRGGATGWVAAAS